VVGIPQPGNRAQDDDDDSDVGNRPSDEDRLGGDGIASEVVYNLEYEPASTRQCTTAMNASEMLRCCREIRFMLSETRTKYLKNRRAAKPPPQRRPLINDK